MIARRALLLASGAVAMAPLPGCLDAVTESGFSDGTNPAELSDRRNEVIRLYTDALEQRNDGVRTQDEAIKAFNDAAYDEAIGRFEAAITSFESAVEGFSEAETIAVEIGENESASICETANEETGLHLRASQAGLDAAIAARDGSGDVNEHIEKYRTHVEKARAIEIAEPQELGDVLRT